MKGFELKILDEYDKRFIDALKDLGMSRNVATTLTYLTNVPEASSQEIEMSTGLRQPEVSVAMRYMSKNTWVDVHDKKTAGKGRPTKIYSLSAPVDKIVQHYENRILEETQITMKAIDKLKNISKLV
ncbi:MAG: transcriptional regulator protein [Methanosarcinaceae archaeon]|nr:transcriptional regulator protein [Methanosarcinaceae archaeon]